MAEKKPSTKDELKTDAEKKKASEKKPGKKDTRWASKNSGGKGETPIHTVRVPDNRWEAAQRATKGTEDGVSGIINQALRKKTGV